MDFDIERERDQRSKFKMGWARVLGGYFFGFGPQERYEANRHSKGKSNWRWLARNRHRERERGRVVAYFMCSCH